jgi:flagellar hook-associated protein 2
VASIVSQLMTVENQPLNTLNSKISATQTLISDLGTMTSKVDALQQAVNAFESASTYSNPTASTSNSSIAAATATSNSLVGSTTTVSVQQLAQASNMLLHASSNSGTPPTYTDFTSAAAPTNINNGANPFELTVGTGSSATTYSTADASRLITGTGANGAVTLNDLATWINNLGAGVQANIVQTSGSNAYVLQITSISTGSANAVSIAGNGISANTVESIQSAQDAQATINGISVVRSSNAISDVIPGLTINLTGQSTSGNTASITVAQGADTTNAAINTLITAYNGVISTYNTMTANANSTNSTGAANTNGDFANNPTMLSFMNDIKQMFAQGATDPTSLTISGVSAASDALSIDTTNGYLQVGSIQYAFSTIGKTNPTAGDFINWINSLGVGITANLSTNGIVLKNNSSNSNSPASIDLSGVTNNLKRNTTSLASMGMDLQLDGTIQFNTTEYESAVANGLAAKLSPGLKLGFTGVNSNLDTYLKTVLQTTTGILPGDIAVEQQSTTQMQKQASSLQEHLAQVQQNYINQYSALNALLYQLNSTSTALANSLLAVTNINAGK